jgi:hypothetical protein
MEGWEAAKALQDMMHQSYIHNLLDKTAAKSWTFIR